MGLLSDELSAEEFIEKVKLYHWAEQQYDIEMGVYDQRKRSIFKRR